MLIVIAQIVETPDDVDRPKEERQFGAFVVETHSAGCSAARLRFMGVRGIYNGEVHLRDVFVPVENRLGKEKVQAQIRRALESLTVGRLNVFLPRVEAYRKSASWFAGFARRRGFEMTARSATHRHRRKACRHGVTGACP